MEVLILSKTHMNHNKCCVGGMTTTGRYVRLLTEAGENQDEKTELDARQIWDIEFLERKNNTPPHIEDVLVQSKKHTGNLKKEIRILDFIEERKIPVWRGHPDNLFDSKIKWTASGSGYIDKKNIPEHSVGFWISDQDLSKKEYQGIRYNYPSKTGWRSIKFKGYEKPIEILPKGTLLRVSLARWVSFDATDEPKCWLQLSGWYDLIARP